MLSETPGSYSIPTQKQTAAVAFHCDEPKSRAPQAVLLAVCPDERPYWDDQLLLATLQARLSGAPPPASGA